MESASARICNDHIAHIKTKVLDLGEDGHYFGLYKTYPYFVDVLEWIEGIRLFSAIRHNYSEEEFRKSVLPELLSILKREALIRGGQGELRPVYADVMLKNIPRDPLLQCELVAAQLDTFLQRAFVNHLTPRIDVVRTRAQPEQIKQWRRSLIHIFEDIEDHDDPDGIPFTLNLLSLQETQPQQH